MQEQLKQSAINFGFDANWVASVPQKHNPEVLALAVEAARSGISVDVIMELIDKLGPIILQFIVEWINKKKMSASSASGADIVTGDVIEGVDSQFIDVIVEKYLPIIIQKYLPMIMEKWGPQLIQFVLDLFMKNLTK